MHFACHGSARAEIVLSSDGGGTDPVSAESLASLFGVLGDNVVLVVFNACFASEQAAAIREHVGLAIGMREPIEDRAAIAFASALYGALAYGRSVRDAFELAVAAVEVRHRLVPQLFCAPGIDPRDVRLVPSRSRRRLAVVAAAAVCAMLAGGWQWLAPSHARPRPPPVRGMVRFPATEVRPGIFAASERPAACTNLGAAEDCAVLTPPERVAAVHVAAFELDVHEVSNGDLAAWLNATILSWTTDSYGRVMTRQNGTPLVLASEDCFGALEVTAEGRVIANPDTARWPAVCVTWYGAAEYCRAQHKRLPLAVEWELAAKSVDGRPFPWGNDPPRQDGVAFDLRDAAAAHPRDVGSSPQDVSRDGIHDLGGNVAEWVDDDRGTPNTRTIRGGSWGSRDVCHVLGSGCKRIVADKYSKDVGFRCASSVIEASQEDTR